MPEPDLASRRILESRSTKDNLKIYFIAKKYGLSLQQVEEMLENQEKDTKIKGIKADILIRDDTNVK